MQRKPAVRCFDEKLGGFYSDSSAFRFRVHIDPPQATPRANCLRNHKPLLQDVRLKVRRKKRRQYPRLGLFYFRRMVLEKPNDKKAATDFSFLFVESGLTGPLLVELFYGVQIHNPVVRGSAPAL